MTTSSECASTAHKLYHRDPSDVNFKAWFAAELVVVKEREFSDYKSTTVNVVHNHTTTLVLLLMVANQLRLRRAGARPV